MSSYCPIAKHLIREAAPKGLMLEVVEYPSEPGAVYLRLFAHELAMMKESKVSEIADWMTKLLDKLNGHPMIRAKYSYEVSTELPK